MTERTRMAVLLAFLVLMVALIAGASLGSAGEPDRICVVLGGRPMTEAEANDFADQLHYSAEERADLEDCIAHPAMSD